jgi:putative peptidoglycan lipid II flippase
VSIILNIILCYVLSPVLDVAGLALASAVSSTVSALLLLIPVGRRFKGVITVKFWLDILKMAICAAVMGAAVWGIRLLAAAHVSDGVAGRTLVVAAPAVVGIAVYFIMAYLLRIPEMRTTVSSALKKLRKGGKA